MLTTPTSFDSYALDYEGVLDRGLAASGESAQFFAKARISWLAMRFAELGFSPDSILDYGCGTGNSASFFLDILHAKSVIGVDPSPTSLEVARSKHASLPAEYFLVDDYQPAERVDLVFCNGVFHHIPLMDRPRALRFISNSLRPDGLFAFWENNPWNPGTRYVMSKIPFDRDAITISPAEAKSLLRLEGFNLISVDHCFFFPAFLKALRWLEPYLTNVPLGGQYLVLCRKDRPRS